MDCHTASLFLPLPDGLVIASLLATETQLVVHVACRLPTACCPLCHLPSDRIHGHYGRTVADLPCAGRHVILALSVRKFVCRTPTCPRQIFTERLPDLVQSYARITNRLRDALIALGLATSAEVCTRLAPKLSMLVSAPTLLRRLRTVACPPPKSVRILGVDDWAWKKGQTYGTIPRGSFSSSLCQEERNRSRKARCSASWASKRAIASPHCTCSCRRA